MLSPEKNMRIAFAIVILTASNVVMAQAGKSLSEYAAERRNARPETARAAVLLDHPAPELIVAKWLNTKPMQLQELRGEVVLLDFWAVNCAPCVDAIPRLHALARSRKDLAVVTIHPPRIASRTTDASGKSVWTTATAEDVLSRFLPAQKFTLPVGIDHSERTARLYAVKAVPLYVLVDRAGVVRYEGNALPSAGEVARLGR
jgi:thiol-disulfide isomerase/thioredoxin